MLINPTTQQPYAKLAEEVYHEDIVTFGLLN